MDPSRCSIVVCFQPAPAPFLIESVNSYAYNDQPSYTPLLESVFGKVFVHSNPADALGRVKQIKHGSPTILLLDIDVPTSTALDDNNNDDDDTVYTPSCSSSCSTDSSSSSCITDSRLVWVKRTARDLDQSVPIIACSTNDSADFMLDCIHAGAADYLLKPLHLDVIKTLFLKLHRGGRSDSKMHEDAPSFLPASLAPTPPLNASAIYPGDGLQHRINEIFTKDTRFTQSVMDIYAKQLVSRTKYRGLPRERAMLLQHKVSCWDFDPFEFNHDDLIHCAYLIFEQVLVLPELSYLTFSDDQLYDFIIDLSGAYHDGNPYHNFAHAVDVLQCLYYFLYRLGVLSFANAPMNHTTAENLSRHNQLQYLLQPKHIFALLIAALGHDAAHPGVNNAFLINSGSPLALLYSDRSVLESLHSMTLFQVLKKHGFDQIGGGPSSTDYKEFRKIVVTSILSTDMALHGDYVERIKAQAMRIADMDFEKLDSTACENERLLICSALIKCADISNVTRPFIRAVKWAELLVEECVLQGDLERAMDLPSMPLNDRDKVVLEDSQLGFIKFVALGLFEVVRDVLPEMSFAVEYIKDNLKRWEDRKNTAHNLGVSSLSESTTTTATLAGTKRRNSSLDYKAVEVLRKRLSLDNGGHSAIEAVRRRSVGTIMPVTDHHRRLHRLQPVYTRVDHHHHHHHHHHEPPPEPSSSTSEWRRDDPSHCQCTIQ